MPTTELFKIKDIVWDHFGRVGFPSTMLDRALEGGRREVEQAGNFWWMRTTKEWSLTVGTNEYPLLVSTGVGLNLPNYKDLRALKWKESGDVDWEPIDVGHMALEEAEEAYSTDEEGSPEIGVIDNVTLILFPPEPDLAYNMKMWLYQYTAFPSTGDTGSDELTNKFPDALVYASLAWGYEQQLKDPQGANYWRELLFKKEIPKIKRENLKREFQERINFTPSSGPHLGRRRLDNVQIYKR